MTSQSQPTPSSYGEALAILGKYNTKKIANNTYIERFDRMFKDEPLSIGIRLHATYIVKFYDNGTTELDSGGYLTQTTHERINRYLPTDSSLSQRNGLWGYSWVDIQMTRMTITRAVEFHDGLTIDSETGAVLTQFLLIGEKNDR